MKRLIPLYTLLSFLFFAACKKHKNTEKPEEEPTAAVVAVTYPSYSAAKVGNYWIYQSFTGDDPMSEGAYGEVDSSYVSKDTLIHGTTFFKYHTTDLLYGIRTVSYLRDSLHYLINSNGDILFSSEDFTTILRTTYHMNPTDNRDTTYKSELKMAERDLSFTVPAGTFITSDAMLINTFVNASYSQSKPFYVHTKYANGVGLIFQSYPTSGNNIRAKRLMRYHLN